MKKICYIMLMAVAVASCTVKEDRDKCPSFLGITVTSQYDFIYQGGKAWSSVYNEDGTLVKGDHLTEMNDRDTTLWYDILPRRTVSAIVSNRDMSTGKVVADNAEEFCALYAIRKDVACVEENVEKVIAKLDKQYCQLTVHLSEHTMPLREQLTLLTTAPFNGLMFPSMTASAGQYGYRTAFDEKGVATVRIPRQGASGLAISLEMDGTLTNSYDLYEQMSRAHYDWKKDSLDDYDITVSVISAIGNITIEDWSIVDIHSYEF